MAHYHFTVKPVSRREGKSPVGRLAYRSGTDLKDHRNGETYYFSSREDVFHVDILLPEGAPSWIVELARECQLDRQNVLQKFSDIIEAAEKRKDGRVYREVEFALPNELTKEQNIEWSKEFVRDIFCSKGMMAIVNYHCEFDKELGIEKPHCHVLLSTRNLTEDGFNRHKNLDWNSDELVNEGREQFAVYQNAALERYGFEARVTHLSYADRGLDIEPQTKLGQNVREMTGRGIETDKQKIFDRVRLKNQFKIVQNPEIVFAIVTSQHATFTRKDVAKVLHRYIDNAEQFHQLLNRLMTSKELVSLEASGIHPEVQEPVYTTQTMLRTELNLVRQAEILSAQKTHAVSSEIVERVMAKHQEKFKSFGGLSPDQEAAIRHMLASQQIACVVGFAGAGKTTCLEVVKEAWEEAGYKILGLAPTGKAARNIENCGIRALTIHKFLLAQKSGRERLSDKTIIVGDEFGMVDSRRCSELLSLVHKTGAKIVPMGDGNQAQSVEAGPAFRLLTERVKPAVLEKIVRQQVDWQREATRLFGINHTRDALKMYQDGGCISFVSEKMPKFQNNTILLETFCLSRQLSGRIWKEMREDFKQAHPGTSLDSETNYEVLSTHPDFAAFQHWKKTRQELVGRIIDHYDNLQEKLKEKGVNTKDFGTLVAQYKASPESDAVLFQKIETLLRQMNYRQLYDTRANTRLEMVKAWAKDVEVSPDQSHLMLAFTNKDAHQLNNAARKFMRNQGKIRGREYEFVTQHIETDNFGGEQRTYHDRRFAQGDRILFTRNNNSLKVKNGTLGTILSLDRTKITVQLDKVGDAGGEFLSFSPNLYPFIDNGWATTIIKAQGVTADHVKLLASFEQYRNLAYVGMSRHRLTLKIYASTLDFWREEKIIDRLSRVQEKLSGFDYLDIDQIQEKLKEDTEILWHHQKIQQGKDFWKAIQVTARDVFDKLLDRPQGNKGEDDFLSFEDSEEGRSRDFFQDLSKDHRKGGLIQDEEVPHHRQHPLSVDSESSNQEALFDPQEHPDPKPENSLDGNSDIDQMPKTVQDQRIPEYKPKLAFTEKLPSFAEADEHLKEVIHQLAIEILGKPTRRTATQLRFGKKGSICVFIQGPKQGIYANFETGVKGGPLTLIKEHLGFSTVREALKWSSEWREGTSLVSESPAIEKTEKFTKSPWTPIMPVPTSAENPDIANNKYLKGMLSDGYQEVSRHAYRDEQGHLKGYVVRFEKSEPDGSKYKKTPPLAYCSNEQGIKAWRWQAFETDQRTPYGIEKLAQDPAKPILIVSGEKTADFAAQRLPDYHVLTWLGGDANVSKTTWDSLIGKNVILWPDHDESGQTAAIILKEILTQLNASKGLEASVSIVDLPSDLPPKWDLADDLPEGWTLDTVRQMIQETALLKETTSVQDKERTAPRIESLYEMDDPKERVPSKSQAWLDPFAQKREQFEKERLPFHQEWCAHLGFFQHHKRFPENESEMSAAYWQGERLTAIEGRLYGEALKAGKKKIDEEKLTLQARAELAKNQVAPDPVLVFGKASDLTEPQLKQFEQHVLLYRDKTGQLPRPSDMNSICQVIQVHAQVRETEGFKDKVEGQESSHTQPQNSPENSLQKNPGSPTSDNYRTLIEQQALLRHSINRERTGNIQEKLDLKTEASTQLFKSKEIQEFCADRLQRTTEKAQEMKAITQDMKTLEINRQNHRGMEV